MVKHDILTCAIFSVDRHGLINEWNDAVASGIGFTRGEVLGNNFVDVHVSIEFRSSARQILNNVFEGKAIESLECPFITKDQHRVNMLLILSPQIDANGHVSGVVCIGHDITDRKKTEVKKTNLALKLRNFIDTANAPIFGIDADGLVNEWNIKLETITGFSREEVLGKNLVKVITFTIPI